MDTKTTPDRPLTIAEVILIILVLLLFTPMGWVALFLLAKLFKP